MRLQFLLQLEAYQNNDLKEVVKVEDSKVTVDGKPFVDLDNIPFAARNKEYRRLKDEIASLESEIKTFESVLASGPNPAIEELLGKKRSERYYKKEELSEHENLLFNTALRIAQQQGERISQRMARAMEAFEDGRASDANTILDEAPHDARALREEIANTKELLKRQQETAAISISELLLKASVMLSDDTRMIDDRVEAAYEIYKEAYALANECNYNQDKYIDMLDTYGGFLETYAKYQECIGIRTELYQICLSVLGENHPDVATCLNNIGLVYKSLGEYGKALDYYERSLKIRLLVLGENHPRTRSIIENIEFIKEKLGESQEPSSKGSFFSRLFKKK